MMSQMNELVHITDALFQVEQAKMQQIAAEEAAIRAALADLDAQYNNAQNDAKSDMTAIRALGADLLWQVWVGKKRANLQMELAKVLVRKAQAAEGLRYAFGKNHVAGQLLQKETAQKGHKKAAKNLRIEQDRLAF